MSAWAADLAEMAQILADQDVQRVSEFGSTVSAETVDQRKGERRIAPRDGDVLYDRRHAVNR